MILRYFTQLALATLVVWPASAQDRKPYYGEGRNYLDKESPIPSDPEELVKNVARWEAIRSGKDTREYKDFGLVMSMTEEQLRAVVPRQTSAYKPGCQNCAAHGLGRGEITRAGRWFWPYRFDPLNPQQVVCSKCEMTFPNPKFPTNEKRIFYSPSGIKSELEYWEHPETKKPYFINVEIEGLGWRWMEDEALKPLIEAYQGTGDEEYSYRASILMDEVANKFPAYVYGSDLNSKLLSAYSVREDGSKGELLKKHSTTTRIGYRAPTEKMGGNRLRQAYETFSGTEGMKRLSRELGRDVRKHYTENLLYLTDSGLVQSDPSKHSGDWKQGLPGSPALDMGMMLGRPDYLRWYIKCQEVSGFREYYADGGYPEGPGYACLSLNPRSNMRKLNGYTDPADFEIPAGEIRYDNWEYPWGKYYPDGELEDFWRRAYSIWRDISLPDGSPPTFNDANHDSRGPSASYIDRYTPLQESRCVLKPNLKHVILGDGTGHDQFQIHMGFGRGGAHAHHDTLGIQLYGMGHYLLDDIPYPKHIMRSFYSQASTHNTATIDKKDQSGSHGGDVIFYAPRFEGFSAVRVNATDAYPGLAEVYSRTLVAMTNDSKHPYALDVFRVRGGRTHDYIIYGSSYLHPNELEISLTDMKTLPGERPLMADGLRYKVPKDYSAARQDSGMPDPYGIFTDVSVGDATGGLTFQYSPRSIWEKQEEPSQANGFDPRKGALYIHPDKPQVGTIHHVIGQPNLKAITAKISRKPTLENVRGSFPVTILRSEPEDESYFIVIHEPYLGNGHITSVKQLPSEPGQLVVEVTMPDRVDRIFMSTDDQPLDYDAEGFKTDAVLAAVSTIQNEKPKAWMIGGTTLEFPSAKAALKQNPARYEGAIANSLRKIDGDPFYGFELTGDNLPSEGTALKGSPLIVQKRYPGEWGKVRSEDDKNIHFDTTFAGLSLNLLAGGNLQLVAAGSDGAPLESGEILHADAILEPNELLDGLTIELSANEAGWSFKTVGADSVESAEGEWGKLSFADLFRDEADIRIQVADTRERWAKILLDEVVVEGDGGVLFRDTFGDGNLSTSGTGSTNGGFFNWAHLCAPMSEKDGIARVEIDGGNFASGGIASQSTFDVAPATGFKAKFKLASLRAGAGRLVGISIHSVNDGMLMKDRLSAIHQEMIDPGETRIDSETEEAKRFPVGAGWAFEIDSIQIHGGKTYAVVKSDHGLIITPKGLREVYLPHRILSKETKWWINSIASTQPIRQLIDTSPIDLQSATVVELPAGAKVGIVHRVLKKVENSKELETVRTEIQDTFDFFDLSNQIHQYDGYLKVPADGIYTFHFRPGARGSLSLGGQVISHDHVAPHVTGNIMPRRAAVQLKQGYVPISWTFEGAGGGTYGGKGCGFSFEGPGVPRTKFQSEDFYHVTD